MVAKNGLAGRLSLCYDGEEQETGGELVPARSWQGEVFVEHGDYSREEAHRLLGTSFESLIEFAGVPRGSRGKVVEVDASGDHWNIAIEWERPKGSLGNGGAPLRSWFTQKEVKQFLGPVQEP